MSGSVADGVSGTSLYVLLLEALQEAPGASETVDCTSGGRRTVERVSSASVCRPSLMSFRPTN